MAKKKQSFEEQLEALKQINRQLEEGQLSLDDSLKLFESGIKLYRECTSILDDAQKQVTQLMDQEMEVPLKVEDQE